MQDSPELLTLFDAHKLTKIQPCTFRLWIRLGKIPCVRLGRAVRLRRADLDKLIEGSLSMTVAEHGPRKCYRCGRTVPWNVGHCDPCRERMAVSRHLRKLNMTVSQLLNEEEGLWILKALKKLYRLRTMLGTNYHLTAWPSRNEGSKPHKISLNS